MPKLAPIAARREALEASERLAAGLVALGVEVGDHVAMIVALAGTEELSRFARRALARTPWIGTAYVVVLGTGDDGSLVVLTIGDYADDLVKLDGRWRLQTRTFSRWAKPGSLGTALPRR